PLQNESHLPAMVWPHLAVRRTRYRFRVLGAASSRFFNLRFVCAAPHNYPDFTPPITGDVLPIVQIGTDGGYLPHPVTCSSLLLAPGERHDILVDFSSLPASCADVILTNDAPRPSPRARHRAATPRAWSCALWWTALVVLCRHLLCPRSLCPLLSPPCFPQPRPRLSPPPHTPHLTTSFLASPLSSLLPASPITPFLPTSSLPLRQSIPKLSP
ncbi:unnamed protein product, partial [Closterium sp. NIES-54]